MVKISVHTLILASHLKIPYFRFWLFKTDGSGALIDTVNKGYSPVESLDVTEVPDSEVSLSNISETQYKKIKTM